MQTAPPRRLRRWGGRLRRISLRESLVRIVRLSARHGRRALSLRFLRCSVAVSGPMAPWRFAAVGPVERSHFGHPSSPGASSDEGRNRRGCRARHRCPSGPRPNGCADPSRGSASALSWHEHHETTSTCVKEITRSRGGRGRFLRRQSGRCAPRSQSAYRGIRDTAD